MDIIQRIAQLESEQIGERVYDGLYQKAKTNSGNLGFNIPYGYDYIDGVLTINKTEKEYVKMIYSSYRNGYSMKRIAETLNKQNVKTKQNKKWGSQTISNILKNPLYYGAFHWGEFIHSGKHEAIIDKNSFNEVQYEIRSRKNNIISNKSNKKIN